ncbi:Bgt-20136, partial [Blumeria graminis f. sp. tritici]
TIPFRANRHMSTVAEMFDELSGQIMNNGINLHKFDHLVHAIFKKKHDRFILDLSLKILYAEYKESPLPTPTNSIMSH